MVKKKKTYFSLQNFKDWTTTILGLISIIVGLIVGFKTQILIGKDITVLNVVSFAVLILFGFALLGMKTPDWVSQIIEKKKDDIQNQEKS